MVLERYKKMILSLWPDNLKEQLAKENGTVKDGLIALILSSVFYGICGGVSRILSGFMIFGTVDSETYSSIIGAKLCAGVLIPIIIPILMVVLSFVGNGIIYYIARALGGKGTYEQQFYHVSIFFGGILILSGVFSITIDLCFLGILTWILRLYGLYLAYLVFKSVHKLSTGRAVLLTAMPVILIVVALVVIIILIFTMMPSEFVDGMMSQFAANGVT